MLKQLHLNYYLFFFIFIIGINPLFADLMSSKNIERSTFRRIDAYIYGGPVYSKLHNDQSVAINSFVVNNYETTEKVNWQGLWGLGIGHTFNNSFNAPFVFSVGLTGYVVNLGRVEGSEYPFINDDIYDILNYQFTAKSRGVLGELRLFYTSSVWQPFVLIGFGPSWNSLNNYSETATIASLSAASIPTTFLNRTNNTLAYEMGVGIQHKVYEDEAHKICYSSSLDYRYANFGKGKLAGFPAQTTGQTLQVSSLNTQGIVFSLKASFG